MALMDCPECGEKVSITATVCVHCGYLLKKQKKRRKNSEFKVALILFFLVALLVGIFFVNEMIEAYKCNDDNCFEKKYDNSQYCINHTCQVDKCGEFKDINEVYCNLHTCNTFLCEMVANSSGYCNAHEKEYCCIVEGCSNNKMAGSRYCYSHTCAEPDCTYKIYLDGEYCLFHQVDMREELELKGFDFSINSAGGIEFEFSATNTSTRSKTIKYIRFYVELYNSVGDRIEDEIKDTSSVYVEITGPVEYKKGIYYEDIIGYNDNCGKIVIEDITIVYMDGTTFSGHYGYYATR